MLGRSLANPSSGLGSQGTDEIGCRVLYFRVFGFDRVFGFEFRGRWLNNIKHSAPSPNHKSQTTNPNSKPQTPKPKL
jgi:hypothetical protein